MIFFYNRTGKVTLICDKNQEGTLVFKGEDTLVYVSKYNLMYYITAVFKWCKYGL